MPFLVTCKRLFLDSALPIATESVNKRPLALTGFHRHEFFEMLFVVRGSLLNRLDTEEIVLRAGDLLVTKPYVQHVLAGRRQKRSATAYFCSFLPQVIDSNTHSLEEVKGANSPDRYFFKPLLSLAEKGTSAVLLPVHPKRRRAVVGFFQRLQEAWHAEDEGRYARMRHEFLGLLVCLADGYTEDQTVGQRIERVFTVAASRYNEGLRKVLNHIHDHIEKPLSLGDMAAMGGMSVSYFCMLFKHATGTTFLNYLTGLRLDQACALLRSTSENISDVCYRAGFHDYSHFSRQFKKAMGMTPGAYRRQNQPVRRIEVF